MNRDCDWKTLFDEYRPVFKKPTNPLRPYTPYRSKYFIDRRFDPPRPITKDDIYRAMKELSKND